MSFSSNSLTDLEKLISEPVHSGNKSYLSCEEYIAAHDYIHNLGYHETVHVGLFWGLVIVATVLLTLFLLMCVLPGRRSHAPTFPFYSYPGDSTEVRRCR